MADKPSEDVGVGCAMAALTIVLIVPFLWLQVWSAMTIWAWFAPWPLPFSVTQGIGMKLAWSLVTSSATQAKDERTNTERFAAFLIHGLLIPALALALAWAIKQVAP